MTDTQTIEPIEEVQSPVPQAVEQDPPKDRTAEQFDKLKESNQELKQERDHYKNVLQSLRPDEQNPTTTIPQQNYSHLNQTQVETITNELVDENGYIDMNRLNNILSETNQRVIRAEKAAQEAKQTSQRTVRDFEESATMREVHKDFPELDPESSTFNEEYYDAVRNELVGQMLKGQREDVRAAAGKWHTRLISNKEKAQEQEKIKEEQQQARAVINTTPSGGAGRARTSTADLDDLKRRTMLGDRNALKERLEKSGF